MPLKNARIAVNNLFTGSSSLLITYYLRLITYSLFPINLQHLFQILDCVDLSDSLSCLQRLIRGNRRATPDLWRLEAAMPSNAISNTNSGFTVRTGPNFSNELRFTNASTCANSLSVNPEYALVKLTS